MPARGIVTTHSRSRAKLSARLVGQKADAREGLLVHGVGGKDLFQFDQPRR